MTCSFLLPVFWPPFQQVALSRRESSQTMTWDGRWSSSRQIVGLMRNAIPIATNMCQSHDIAPSTTTSQIMITSLKNIMMRRPFNMINLISKFWNKIAILTIGWLNISQGYSQETQFPATKESLSRTKSMTTSLHAILKTCNQQIGTLLDSSPHPLKPQTSDGELNLEQWISNLLTSRTRV